jgi:hypothetical protein
MKRAYARDKRERIDARRKAEHDEATRLETARPEGKIELARRLLENGIPRDQVLQLSGLKPE